jgi:exosortase/archaeosortase family protein
MSASMSRASFVVLPVLIGSAWLYWATSESLLQVFREETFWEVRYPSQLPPFLKETFCEWRYPGQLVPFLALLLVWRDRRTLMTLEVRPCLLGGALLLLFAEAARLYALYDMKSFIEPYALVLGLAAVVLMVTGRRIFKRLASVLLFLCLTAPLPPVVGTAIRLPLDRLATWCTDFILFGSEVPPGWGGVEGRCLPWFQEFVIVAAFIACLVKRPLWYKTVLLLSSIPIAMACNIMRVLLTAVTVRHVSVQLGERCYHDFAGLIMMPIAIVLFLGEIRLLDGLFSGRASGVGTSTVNPCDTL